MKKPGAGRKSPTYVLVTADKWQLPVSVGTKYEVAETAGVSTYAIVEGARKQRLIAYKYRVFVLEEDKDEKR